MQRPAVPANPQRRTHLLRALGLGLAGLSPRLAAAATGDTTPQPEPGKTGLPQAAAQAPALPPSPPPLPLPESLAWKDAQALIVHNPHAIETRRGIAGQQVITPTRCLFVRNNALPPSARSIEQADDWAVSISGVATPDAFTLGELRQMPSKTVATVLQCAENGRGLTANPGAGTPWLTGAAGCVIWTGVPLSTVVRELGGVRADSRFLTALGGDTLPRTIASDFTRVERSVPLSALDNALLAWRLNGEPLPLVHGGPLRLVLPGYASINYIKYVRRIAFTHDESSAHIQTSEFRVPLRAGQPQVTIPAWRLPVKSWITAPLPVNDQPLTAGDIVIQGVAMGGSSAVAHIEISTDGGLSWQPAQFTGMDFGPFAWRLFEARVTLPAGSATLACRAANAAGQQQPEYTTDDTGYFVNGWREHQLSVTLAAAK